MKTLLENPDKTDQKDNLPELSDRGVTINGRYVSYEDLADTILRKCLTMDTFTSLAPNHKQQI
ncbi:MAG: hypothetical protein FJ088_00525 [Deltaproteobacteria bacterium]|nr:hypothetical protein [Deltaproteobacteria bacterium]